MTGVSDAASIAATASGFLRSRQKEQGTSGYALGRMIMLSSAVRDRALDKIAYEVSEELRALNCTPAAIASSDDNEGAHLYLERVVEAGIASHEEKTRREARLAKQH